MKRFVTILTFVFIFLNLTALAQRYAVTGTVVDEQGSPLKGTTVFVGGTDRVTSTDDNGRFEFIEMPPGTFQVSVQIMGYMPNTQTISFKEAPVNVNFKLKIKPIHLDKVVIGKANALNKNLLLFKDNFLGKSENAKQCVILNPEVINFSTKKGLLLADADDFLIIENKRLGYRLRYQLKDFGYKITNDVALYHGECTFESLKGTSTQQKDWAKNREDTYRGSFMHFLRSVYDNKTAENGFVTRPVYKYVTLKEDSVISDLDWVVIDDKPVKFDSLVTVINNNFVSFKFKQLYIYYDPKKAANTEVVKYDLKQSVQIARNASVLRLAFKEAVIDQKGSYTDYRDFFIHGNWARARVGDQLPVDYKAPK